MALLFLDGAEHRSIAVLNGMWDPIGGDTTTRGEISTALAHSGTASWRFNTSGATKINRKSLGGASVTVVHAYLRIETEPSGPPWLVRVRNAADTQWVTLKYDVGGNGIILDAYDGVSNPESSLWGISLNQWYRLEFLADTSTNPWNIKARVDGVEKVLTPAFAAITQDVVDVGMNADVTGDLYFDDIAVWTGSAGDYPCGDLQVERLLVDSSGTHNLDASPSSFFGQHDGATGTALTTGETAAWQRVDDIPIGASSDYLYIQGAPGAGQYAELNFAATTSTPSGVKVVESVRQATATGSVYTSKISDDGTNVSDVSTAIDPASATEVARATTFSVKPSGGAWTQAAVNALRYRFGYTSDASPDLRMYAVMAEVLSAAGSQQTLVPDADITTTGWTTAPLFSKVNDSSDSTFITATAS